jgi:hypothetical protein
MRMEQLSLVIIVLGIVFILLFLPKGREKQQYGFPEVRKRESKNQHQ